MPVVPGSLAALLSLLRPAFTAPTFETFCALVVGFIGRIGERTVCGMWQAARLAGRVHHSRAHDFFARADWCGDRLGLLVLDLLLARFCDPEAAITLAVDGSVFARSGRKVHGAVWHHDASAAPHGRGLRFGNCCVCLGLVVRIPALGERPWCLPVLVRLWLPTPKPTTRTPHPRRRPSQQELAAELVALVAARYPARRIHVVGDAAFACQALAPSRSDGSVEQPLVEQDVAAALEVFQAEGAQSIAVAFINSYTNPAHELLAEHTLRNLGFDGEISLSHRVSGEYREYERTTTTVVDAYVRPRTSQYLRRLAQELRNIGFSGSPLVTRSGGGAMTFDEAEYRPFETIQSGPVAGAEGVAELSRNLHLGDVIGADVGGTSFDTFLITGGRPQMMNQGMVFGLPVQTPWVDVRSIGAGGGSIAHVDASGLLKVGPGSAGADPGPACYGRGGTEPTVTDAAAVLGLLAEGKLTSGMQLDLDRANAALAPLAEALRFDIAGVARGVLTILAANMADAIRTITIERGYDPRGMKLVPFGGAGPLFGTLLARELDMQDIVIPPYAGNFSAWGLLGADLTQTAARTKIMPLDEGSLDEANRTLEEMFNELESRSTKRSSENSNSREVSLDMRYVGQEYTLTIPVEAESGRITQSLHEIWERFTRDYEQAFAHTLEENVEIVNLRAAVRTPLPRRAGTHRFQAAGEGGSASRAYDAYSFAQGEWLPFQVLDRSRLPAGAQFAGPAIVLEETTTTYIDVDFEARVHPSGALFVTNAKERID